MSVRPRYVIEYVVVRMMAFIIQRLPYHGALLIGWIVAWLAFYVFRFRVREAKSRIREVFGSHYTAQEVDSIAWRSWRNFVFSGVELIRIPVSTTEWVRSVVDDGNSVEKISVHSKTGKGAIIALAHMGSWEMAALASISYHIPMFSIAAQQKNQMVDDFMNRMRAGTGLKTILRDSSVLKNIIRNIREGKVLAMLLDVRSPTEALAIRFLGKTANIAGGLGFIAKQTGVPVFPCVITRKGWGRHQYRVFDPIWPDPGLDKQSDSLRITQAVFDVFDPCIRAEPDQWFWFNKRWVFDPL